MDSFETVLKLLCSSLWGCAAEPMQLSDEEWEDVYRTASVQGVHTLVFDAFRPGCVPPQPLLAHWMADVSKAEFEYQLKAKVQKEMSAIWNSEGIRFSVLKGQSIACMYPHPEHRLSGDIDFYFPDEESWNKALCIASKIAAPELDSDGDIHYVWKDVTIEHHRHWNHLSSVNEDGDVDILLLIYSHILRHSMVGGMGLRQLADLAVATRSLYGGYDIEALSCKLRSSGLCKWGELLAAVLTTYFGLSATELPFIPDSTYLDVFMTLVRRDGNLGKENSQLTGALTKRTVLFMKVCPRELFSRWFSLARGRMRRIFTNAWK